MQIFTQTAPVPDRSSKTLSRDEPLRHRWVITKRKLLDDCYNDLLLVALPMPTSEPGSQHIVRRRERIWYTTLLAATAINCALQITWFWRFRGQNIVMDGIAY